MIKYFILFSTVVRYSEKKKLPFFIKHLFTCTCIWFVQVFGGLSTYEVFIIRRQNGKGKEYFFKQKYPVVTMSKSKRTCIAKTKIYRSKWKLKINPSK